MVRLTELPLEIIIEIIKQVPQGLVTSEYPASIPDWSQVSKSEQNQNDEDQIQLYQLMRVNRLFRACVLRFLNTPRHWPYYLPPVKDTALALTFEEQIAVAASEFELLKNDIPIVWEALGRTSMSLRYDLTPRLPNISKKDIRECVAPFISRQEELSQKYTAALTAVTAQRPGNINLDKTYLLSGEHAVEQTQLSLMVPALGSYIGDIKARLAETP